jgi:hypothetical protein
MILVFRTVHPSDTSQLVSSMIVDRSYRWHHLFMTSIYIWMTRTLFLRCMAFLVGVTTVLMVSSWVDGRNTHLTGLALTALPVSICLSTAWTLSSWRHQGGGIAIAAGGRSPWSILLLIIAIAGPPFALRRAENTEANASISIGHAQIDVVFNGQNTHYRWNHGQTVRTGSAPMIRTRNLPAPLGTAALLVNTETAQTAIRFVLLSLLAYWLMFIRLVPSTSRVCLAATVCITAAHLIPWCLL